ncbi:hypothetical protein PspLS_10591 [Pyricularia sp. CBS 133598]|nr:hypothetical protein PspLS_10591 [Pyricularia sp. CBS 133598]
MQLNTIFQLATLLAIRAVAIPTGPIEPRADEANEVADAQPVDLGPPEGWSLMDPKDLPQDTESKVERRGFTRRPDPGSIRYEELPTFQIVNKNQKTHEHQPHRAVDRQSSGLKSPTLGSQVRPGSPGARAPATA